MAFLGIGSLPADTNFAEKMKDLVLFLGNKLWGAGLRLGLWEDITSLPFTRGQIELLCDFCPKGVIHVGAHLGQEVPLYRKWQLQRIHLIEPQPAACSVLRRRYHRCRDVRIHECAAVSHDSGFLPMYAEVPGSPNLSASASLLKPARHLTDYPHVQFSSTPSFDVLAATLDSLDITDADFMVIDTQGSELEVLRGGGKTLRRIRWLIVEYWQNEAYENVPCEDELVSFVTANGFRPVLKTFDRTFGDYLFVRG